MQNRRSGQCYSMNHPSEWLLHRAFKRYCGSKIVDVVVVANKISRHSMAVHHSALVIIAIAHKHISSLKTPLRSSHKPQPFRSYQENIACWLPTSIISDSIISAWGSIQEAAPHVSELLCYVEGKIELLCYVEG